MTTTASFQKNPDFWGTKDQALNHKETINTNGCQKSKTVMHIAAKNEVRTV